MDTLKFKTRGNAAVITCRVQPRAGEHFYLCNNYEDVRTAIDVGRPFEAHKVIGMEPHPVTLNPAHLISVEPTT